MPAIQISPFLATLPKQSANLLPDGAAQVANNVKLLSGELRPWRKEVKLADIMVANAQSLYRLYSLSVASSFLSWPNDVDVVTSPLTDAVDHRIYYTGDTTPRKTNFALAVSGPGPYPYNYLEMGVPVPLVPAIMLVSVNGTGVAETRVYLYTFVSTFGSIKEEGQPIICKDGSGNTSIVVNPVGSTIHLSGLPAAPPSGKYNITNIRIYRTNVGTSDFGLIAELPIGTTAYDDSAVTGSTATILNSVYYQPPPSDLIGLVSMPNGMIAGFRRNTNEVWFCEPYFPHAWPAKYTQTVDSNVIGLGVFGTSLVVMTERVPFIISGVNPSVMTVESVQINEPCISKKSICNDEFGVVYASPNGLVGIGPTQRGLISEFAYTRDEWQAIDPSHLFAQFYGHDYVAFNIAQAPGVRNALIMQRTNSTGVSNFSFPAKCFYIDRKTGNAFAISENDNNLYQLDADKVNNSNYQWNSKRYAMPQEINFTCFQVDADFKYMYDAQAINAIVAQVISANQALAATGLTQSQFNSSPFNTIVFNGSNLAPIPESAQVRVISATIIADGNIVCNRAITSRDPLRMPDGYKAYDWEIQLSGNVPLRKFAMATSMAELKQI